MKLAISNIAWLPEDEILVLDLMGEFGICGVEIAPTKIWDKPLEAKEEDIIGYRRFWNDRGIEIVALQALLYGRADLTLFESKEARANTLQYLRGITRLGGTLGARVLVFGSPKNRRIGELASDQAGKIARDFFEQAAETAEEEGVVLCIEPNPEQYKCDFVTTAAEGLELVRNVNRPGFGLHLDAGALNLTEDAPESALRQCAGSICHFHVSEPYLGPVGRGSVDHDTMASVLRQLDYPNWVSVEMRHDPSEETEKELRRVFSFLKKVYGDESV